MKIAICGAEDENRESLKEKIKDSCQRENLFFNINLYSDITSFLASGNNIEGVDLVVIDIGNTKSHGIDESKVIRESGYKNDIIFFASRKDEVFDCFIVEPLNYILDYNENDDVLDETLRLAGSKEKDRKQARFCASCAGETFCADIGDICYFKSVQRIIEMHCENDDWFSFYTPISKLEKTLEDKNFIRIHRSYIVSAPKIKNIDRGKVYLNNGEVLPMGKSYYRACKTYLEKIIL